jgi:hypothetical protein
MLPTIERDKAWPRKKDNDAGEDEDADKDKDANDVANKEARLKRKMMMPSTTKRAKAQPRRRKGNLTRKVKKRRSRQECCHRWEPLDRIGSCRLTFDGGICILNEWGVVLVILLEQE